MKINNKYSSMVSRNTWQLQYISNTLKKSKDLIMKNCRSFLATILKC